MRIIRNRGIWVLTGAAWSLIAGVPAMADDTELFVGKAGGGTVQPNILLILDTSGSMRAEVKTQTTYNPATTYSGSCSTSRVYWRSGTGEPPSCGTDNWFNDSALACSAAEDAFDAGTGSYTDVMAQYGTGGGSWWGGGSSDAWDNLDNDEKDEPVECEADSGKHGDGSDPDLVYAQDDDANNLWTDDPLNEIAWGQNPVDDTYTVYDGNYLNWYYGPTSTSTRIEVIKEVATDLVNSISGVNIGLMRFNEREGGPVIHEMADVADARSSLTSAISGLSADGWTPLSETLYEAGQYYRGASIDYGDVGPIDSVDASRTSPGSGTYDSPIGQTCQKNFIVLLTDGEPTQDVSANEKIPALPDFGSIVGSSCDSNGSDHGKCLDDMADYLHNADISDLDGDQNVTTYTIGFAVDLDILESTAQRGGGEYYQADDTATLSTALTNIVTSVLDTKTTFVAPSVAVNSFNRTQNLNELYMAVFQPTGDVHWPGNLKKYVLDPVDGDIVDADGDLAVDLSTGFFYDTARSFWSVTADGSEVTAGGAANQLPDPGDRNVYTYLGVSDLTHSSNEVHTDNGLIDAEVLGLGNPGDPSVDDVIDFSRGVDVQDEDGDGNTSEARYAMGDPLHAQPQTVIYGGTPSAPDLSDAVVYLSTNDGYLHAIDASTGEEKWAFIPPEFLEDLRLLYENDSVSDRHYGIDGNATVQYVHKNDDGVIDANAGERVYMFIGMRRGGSFYYGLDITNPDAPEVMWRLGSGDLPSLGQSWAKPVSTRIAVGEGLTQNEDHRVLVIGGGYDPTQDSLTGSTDTSGNAIYIVDAVSGELLWHASDSGADRNLSKMLYSIPADIKVIDLNGDRYADRMYAADMGGQLWRFDIFNGENASSLVNGGVIAQLGAAPSDSPTEAESRRFFYAPDAALVDDGDSTFINIAIGSGHRANPNSTSIQDRFYAIRDYLPFGSRTQAAYDAIGTDPITDDDLIDITDDVNVAVPAGADGWRLEMRVGGWSGEKVLAKARTFDSKIFFTSFSPDVSGDSGGCLPRLGTNRLYVIDILTGKPVTNLDGSVDEENLTESDRYTEFNGTISSEVVFLFPSSEDENCVGDECTPPPVACVGLFCFEPDFTNNPIRTIWSQENIY